MGRAMLKLIEFFWKERMARRMAMMAEMITMIIPRQNSRVLRVPKPFLSIKAMGAEKGK